MQVAVKDQQDTYRPYLPGKEHVGQSIVKDDKQVTCLEEKGSSICTIKPQTIESLLPDEEDLFSGVIDESGCTVTADGDDEDFDLFSSSGGMEFEGNSKLNFHQRNSVTAEGLNSNQSSSDYLIPSEYHSRTLLVKNVDNTVEDSELRTLFEQHGDIRTFDTSSRCHGFVIISYYDIRAAMIVFCTLQNKPLQNEKLHIHYLNPKDDPSGQYMDQANLEVFNCDSSISNDKLHCIFGSFGEIEKIYGTTCHRHIKYYDIRAAEAAINGLNSTIMLQEIKLEVSYPARAKRSMQQFTHGLVQGQLRSCQNSTRNSIPQDAPVKVNGCSTNCLPSPVGMTSTYDQFGHGSHYSTDQAKLHNPCTSFHPRSLPISCERFDDNGVITYGSLNFESVGFTTETIDEQLHMLGPCVTPMEDMFRGSSGRSRCHHAWSSSNSFQTHQLNPLMWSHSPSFVDGVYAHRISNLPTLSEVLPPVLYTVSPTHKQHVIRSAPSGSLSCKDLQISFMESSKEDLILNPLRVVGFPSTIFHPSGVASQKPSPDSMMCSPHIIGHISPERDTGTTSPSYFSRPRGRVRRISHGRHETVSNDTHEKKYELDIDRVLRGEDCRTTLMIRNIPNKYSSAMLLAAINEHNQGTYDFIYLPLDFKNKCNMGYAFINMVDPLQIVHFHKSFHGKKWEKFHSGKVACLAYARIQGKAALIAHFQESSLMNEDKCCHPILFTTDGPNAGSQEPFPLGPSRRNKNRSLNKKGETTMASHKQPM